MVQGLFDDAIGLVWVEGEISGLVRAASGHLYFTLKDREAQIRCALFRQRAIGLRFRPRDGDRVLARARVSLYAARGDFQLIVETLAAAGTGDLAQAFEDLKAKLAAEGLFDPGRKQPLPVYPRRVGLLTSPTGAAVRDICAVLARRFPLATVELLPIPVQGEGAGAEAARMLAAADAAGRYDVLLVTRGGGSAEDLWAFNDERLVRAIAAARTPMISAIGHEIDFTLTDFVADLRAPTPSAAAELLYPDAAALRLQLDGHRRGLHRALRRRLQDANLGLDQCVLRLNAQRPERRLQQFAARADALAERLRLALRHHQRRSGERLSATLARLDRRHLSALVDQHARRARQDLERARRAVDRLLERARSRSAELARALDAVSPLATLDRGYAVVRGGTERQRLTSVAQFTVGQAIELRVRDGTIAAKVEAVQPDAL